MAKPAAKSPGNRPGERPREGSVVPARATAPVAASQPWRPFESLRREVDRLFEDFGRGFWRPPFGRSLFDIEPFVQQEFAWPKTPAVDIVENDDAFLVSAEVPGLEEKDIDVSVTDGMLTIKGEKHEEREEKKKGYHLRERSFGSFERRFRLPEDVDADRIDASFAKGVLKVTLPKKRQARKAGRQIKVKTG